MPLFSYERINPINTTQINPYQYKTLTVGKIGIKGLVNKRKEYFMGN